MEKQKLVGKTFQSMWALVNSEKVKRACFSINFKLPSQWGKMDKRKKKYRKMKREKGKSELVMAAASI